MTESGRKKRARARSVVAILALTVLAGCGGAGGEDDGSASTSLADTGQEMRPNVRAARDKLDELRVSTGDARAAAAAEARQAKDGAEARLREAEEDLSEALDRARK